MLQAALPHFFECFCTAACSNVSAKCWTTLSIVVKQTVSPMFLSRKASPLTNLCASFNWTLSSWDLDERLNPRLCVMLECRSPQLLDEGCELRIAWSQRSLAQFRRRRYSIALKKLPIAYRIDNKKKIDPEEADDPVVVSWLKFNPLHCSALLRFLSSFAIYSDFGRRGRPRINLFSFLSIPSAVTRRSYNKITYHHNSNGYNDNYHNCNFTRYSHLHF